MSETANDRPIRIEKESRAVQAIFYDAIIASTKDALVLQEAGYPPVHYFPRESVAMEFLTESAKRTRCPHKGEARYWSLSAEGYGAEDAVWCYDDPKAGVTEIAGYIAFDPEKLHISVG